MVKVKRSFVFGAFFTTVIAVGLSTVSLFTDYWVEANLKLVDQNLNSDTSTVRYGLFSGVYSQRLSEVNQAFEITMTCLFSDNVCAMLCRATKEEREQELKGLFNGEDILDFNCPFSVAKSFRVPKIPVRKTFSTKGENKRVFINAGCYICTVIFLVISIAFGLFSTGLLAWNFLSNPVQTVFSIYSLYYYVGTACGAVLVALIIWGALFAASVVENVAILNTLNDLMRHHGDPVLGWSYWLNVGSLILYMVSFGLLMTRKYLMDKEHVIMRNINQGNQVIF